MIFVFLFLITVTVFILTGFYIILPLSNFNVSSVNIIDTKINTLYDTKVTSDIDLTVKEKNQELDFTDKNSLEEYVSLLNNGMKLDEKERNKLGLLSKIQTTYIKNNNIIDSKIVNNHKFGISFEIVPLNDFNELELYTNDSVKNIVVEMFVYKLNDNIDSLEYGTFNKKKVIGLYKEITDVSEGIIGNTANSLNTMNRYLSFVDLDGNEYYYADKGIKFNRKIVIRPFYNYDDSGNIIKGKDDPYFHVGYLYLVKIFFDLDKDKMEKFKLYIPDKSFITLNNVEKIVIEKQNKKYKINKVKIIKNSFINKVSSVEYGF